MKSDETIFERLGWELEKRGSQLVGDCPFCGGHDKMYVDPKKTTYDCKVCDARGNAQSVGVSMFEKVMRPALNKLAVKKLADRRGVPTKLLLNDPCLGLGLDGKLHFLVRNIDGKGIAFRRVAFFKDRIKIRNWSGMEVGLLGAEEMKSTSKEDPIYICEGEWDRASWRYTLKTLGLPGAVVAVPGAGVFKKEWSQWFHNRRVVVLYDNDKPGNDGCVRVAKMLKTCVRSMGFLHWPEGTAEGYDVDDAVKDLGYERAYEFVTSSLANSPPGSPEEAVVDKDSRENEQEALEPATVEQLHTCFQRWLKLDNCDLLDVVMGVLWSVYLPGNPLWMFVVSPPSASKSETLVPTSAWHRCHAVSNLTSKSLVSGFQLQGGGDPSLLAELNGKRSAVIIKDLTPVLEGRDSERDEIFGILRDAYDGSAVKVFGNGVRREYNDVNFAMLAGVTPAIDAYGSVAMGERFLKFRADHELVRADDVERAYRAIMNCGKEQQMREELKDVCVRTLIRKFAAEKVPMPCEEFSRLVSGLAKICADMRAVSPSDSYSDRQETVPIAEAPPRLATQFTKLAQGLALHFEAKTLMDERIVRLLRRVAIHTPDIITVRVIQALYKEYELPSSSSKSIAQRIPGLTISTVQAALTKLARTRTCTVVRLVDGKIGFRLSEDMYHAIKRHGLFGNVPKNDPFYMKPGLIIRRKM